MEEFYVEEEACKRSWQTKQALVVEFVGFKEAIKVVDVGGGRVYLKAESGSFDNATMPCSPLTRKGSTKTRGYHSLHALTRRSLIANGRRDYFIL